MKTEVCDQSDPETLILTTVSDLSADELHKRGIDMKGFLFHLEICSRSIKRLDNRN